MKKELTSALLTIKNKIFAIGVLLVLIVIYRCLPEDKPIPFAELIYAVILVASVITIAPIIRVLVFNEAANYAESGKLDEDLRIGQTTLNYRHYAMATIISYLTALLCVSSLLH